MEDREMIWGNWHGFNCLANLVAFYNGMTPSVDKEVLHSICLDFS